MLSHMQQCQREKKQLEESLAEIKEQEEEMSRANRALTIRLEDVQVRLATLHYTVCREVWIAMKSTVLDQKCCVLL